MVPEFGRPMNSLNLTQLCSKRKEWYYSQHAGNATEPWGINGICTVEVLKGGGRVTTAQRLQSLIWREGSPDQRFRGQHSVIVKVRIGGQITNGEYFEKELS